MDLSNSMEDDKDKIADLGKLLGRYCTVSTKVLSFVWYFHILATRFLSPLMTVVVKKTDPLSHQNGHSFKKIGVMQFLYGILNSMSASFSAQSMSEITKNFRLGFGSFVDKKVMPYVSTVPRK
jgi:hypothetical protein